MTRDSIFKFYQEGVLKSHQQIWSIIYVLAILEFVDDLITKSGLPVGKAEEHVLIYCFQSFKTFASTTHEAIARKITISTAVNVYFKNKRKICTDSVATDGVKTLQKRQREKSPY